MFEFNRACEELLRIIAADQFIIRPDRSEPRARNAAKNYQLFTGSSRYSAIPA